MSIYNYCAFCYTSFALEEKICPACVKKIEKGRQKYRVEVMVNGRRVTRVVPNITIAKEIEAKIKVDAAVGDFYGPNRDITLAQVWDIYYKTKKGLPKIESYKYYFEKYFKRWHHRQLKTVEPHEIELLISELRQTKTQHGRPYTDTTIKGIITFLSMLINYARKKMRVKIDNPCEYVDKPREAVTPIVPLTAAQKTALIAALNEYENVHVANLVRFIMTTGMRRGEVFKLRWADIDIEGRRLVIMRAKSGRNESIPLSDISMAILNYQAQHSDGEFVFASQTTGLPYNDIGKAWSTIKKAAGIPAAFKLHDLRHQFASDLVNAGVDLYVVGQLLRHSSPQVTKRYAHLIDATLRDAIKKIE